MEENWSKGTKHAMKPLREMPGLFYKEMCEAGALGFIQSAPVPLRALYDRALLMIPILRLIICPKSVTSNWMNINTKSSSRW